jgi:hypothetical protein
MRRLEQALFTIGDHLAGGAVGAVTAVGVRAVVSPQLDMVLAMLVGMAIGMIAHLVLTVLLAPVLDPFHVMVPGGLIGMYGGMMFAMRDTMQAHAGSLRQAILVGVVFGVVVVAGVHLYDRAIRGPVLPGRAT